MSTGGLFSNTRDTTGRSRGASPGHPCGRRCDGTNGIRPHTTHVQAGGRTVRGMWVCGACLAAKEASRATEF